MIEGYSRAGERVRRGPLVQEAASAPTPNLGETALRRSHPEASEDGNSRRGTMTDSHIQQSAFWDHLEFSFLDQVMRNCRAHREIRVHVGVGWQSRKVKRASRDSVGINYVEVQKSKVARVRQLTRTMRTVRKPRGSTKYVAQIDANPALILGRLAGFGPGTSGWGSFPQSRICLYTQGGEAGTYFRMSNSSSRSPGPLIVMVANSNRRAGRNHLNLVELTRVLSK